MHARRIKRAGEYRPYQPTGKRRLDGKTQRFTPEGDENRSSQVVRVGRLSPNRPL
jgi:hypothetical protein